MLPSLYLIRHGETEWSLTGRHTGRTDVPLTERGEQESRELGRRLRDVAFQHVLTSPRRRARQTCTLGGWEARAEIEPDLVEWDYGDYEGKRSAEIREARPGWNIFRDGCPHGESPAQVSERADRLIARLRTLSGNLALFSHGHFGRVLGTRWIGLPVSHAQHLFLDTASISILSHEPDRADKPVITQWNVRETDAPSTPAPPTDDAKLLKQRAIERWESEGGRLRNAARQPTKP